MKTFGTHISGSSRTAYPAACDYCGVVWPRSELKRDGAGKLRCPDEGKGMDATTLDRRIAARSRERSRVPMPSDGLYRFPTPVGEQLVPLEDGGDTSGYEEEVPEGLLFAEGDPVLLYGGGEVVAEEPEE